MVKHKKNKKSKARTERQSFSITEALGLQGFFHNERLNFFIGALLLALTVYLTLSFI